MFKYILPSPLKNTALLLAISALTGCSYLVTSMTEDFGQKLTQAMLNQQDPETVAAAIPSYLMLLEALNNQENDSPALLTSTSELYSAYINLIPENTKRRQLLADKTLEFALRSACLQNQKFCQINLLKFPEFEEIIKPTDQDDVPALYTLGSAWATWIQSNRANWNAIAQLAQVKLIMQRIIELDEAYKNGGAHIYLGAMATIIPPSLGGNPETGRKHFERALELSEQRNLMIKVIYARQYARLLFDRELHDRLLHEVLKADPKQPDLTLINSIAQKQAQQLLDSANDYF